MHKTDKTIKFLKRDSFSDKTTKNYKKRSLNWKILRKTLFRMIINFKSMINGLNLDAEFIERIMLAVTSVNDCRYCTYYHTKLALESGCSDEEIREILGGDLSCADQKELPALAFAQHFAESKGNPSKKALNRLISFYGIEISKSIILNIKLISIGNLYGNTISAFESRIFKKTPPKVGSFLFELLVFLLGGFLINKIMKLETRRIN